MHYLITGGSGSLGQAIVRQLGSTIEPGDIVTIYSRGEMAQFQMQQAFLDTPWLRYTIGDVRDIDAVRHALKDVDIVIHAAALKQVPVCEYNPIEAVMTNTVGTGNVCSAAAANKVRKVIVISTDKATNPVNHYGASKLCAEKIAIQANRWGLTRFSVTRYGNVFASKGSVVPYFRELIAQGKPITITHKDMTRFWLTLPEAASFVLDAILETQGGEIFIPKLPSVRIEDIAKALCPTCKIVYTGIRPGEKLHEALITRDEIPYTDDIGKYFRIRPAFPLGSRWSVVPQVPADYMYTSDTNSTWLSVDDLKQIMEVTSLD